MKRKRLDRDIWRSITSRRYMQKRISEGYFQGIAGLLYLDMVSPPSTWKIRGGSYTVCDSGYKWLMLLPDQEDYVVTAMIDAENQIVLWYVDMIAGKGMCEDGVPWFDDLYLDLILLPDGYIMVDDMNELEDALSGGDITGEQFDLAIQTKEKLERGLLSDAATLSGLCGRCMERMAGEAVSSDGRY